MRPARQKILVAFDFSEPAFAALAEATRIARATHAELVLLHVFGDRNTPSEYGWSGGATQRDRDHNKIIDLLEREAEEARSVQALARVRTASGDAADRILETAAAEDVSAVFIGADSHDGFVGALLGRVALRVVREAKAPVFVVRRQGAASTTDKVANRRIVAGFDFTSASVAAVDAAVALANTAGGEVRIVHVLPSTHTVDAEELARLRSRLEELAAEATASGVMATATLAFGDPATALVAETENKPGSVIAVGVRNRSRISKLLLGDVTEQVLRTTNATVMVAHAGATSVPLVALPVIGAPNPSRG